MLDDPAIGGGIRHVADCLTAYFEREDASSDESSTSPTGSITAPCLSASASSPNAAEPARPRHGVPRAPVTGYGEARSLGAVPAPGHALAPLGAAVLGRRDRHDRSDEIIRLAGELGLQPRVVEKDPYVLGWVPGRHAREPRVVARMAVQGRHLASRNASLRTYRFSEDLDFTVTEPAQLDRGFLLARFAALGAWLYDATGIELPGRAAAVRCL